MADVIGDASQVTKASLERALVEVSKQRDTLRSMLEAEIAGHRKIAEDSRWHPFIVQQRQLFVDRLQAILSDVEGGER